MMSLNWLSFQASEGWFIMVMMALSNSSYLSYRKTSSAHRWACSAALKTWTDAWKISSIFPSSKCIEMTHRAFTGFAILMAIVLTKYKNSITSININLKQTDLGNVDSGPEELQVLPHLLWFEFGVEDGQFMWTCPCERAPAPAPPPAWWSAPRNSHGPDGGTANINNRSNYVFHGFSSVNSATFCILPVTQHWQNAVKDS